MLLLFTSLHVPEQSATLGSRVFIQSNINVCYKSNNSGVFDPDESFLRDEKDSYVAPYKNCTEDLPAALHTVTSHTTILLETTQLIGSFWFRMLLISP